MEIENKKLTPEQNRIAIALRGFKLQYETTSNLDVLTDKLKQFIDNIDILDLTTKLSELYDKISSGELSSKAEICGELERIHEDILGFPMESKEEKTQTEITQQAENTQDETLTQSNFAANEVSTVTSAAQHAENAMTSKPESSLAKKLKVDVNPVVTPKSDNSIVSDNSFSFTRTDGSKVKLEVLYHVGNVYYSKLTRCKVTQTFPNLPHGSDIEVITEITTVIDLEAFQNSPEYRAQIKAALSAQNIYDAAANHSTFLHKGISAFNSSNKQLLEYTENQLEKERFTSCEPFDSQYGSLKRLLPVCEFKASTPLNFKQYEYSLSGLDLPHTSLEYLYSNIDMEKLYNNAHYKAFILSQIRKCELSEDSYSFFLIGSPNVQGHYTAITDSTLSKFITAYRDYVSNRQFSTDDEEPGNH